MTEHNEIKNLLLIKMSALGDVVMTLPALAALKKRYPGAAIDWLVEPAAAGLLAGHPYLNRVLVSPRPDLKALAAKGQFRRAKPLLTDFLRDMGRIDYDVVLDLQGLFKSGLMTFLARGRRKVGFDRTREGAHFFLNEKMPPYDPEEHAARRYLKAAAYLGGAGPADEAPLRYYEPPTAAQRGAEALLGPTWNEGFLVLNPGAKWVTKLWPPGHWRTLAEGLTEETGLKLVLTGGPEDARTAEEIGRTAPGSAVNLCGRTSLPELAAILARARLMVSADTGPLHLAAAVGAGGLALFGPTRPNRTGPFGGHFEIMRPPLDCLGCLKKRCPRPCLAELHPTAVRARLKAKLVEERAS
jgi:lipopolysaccharide heptosyltransferase I